MRRRWFLLGLLPAILLLGAACGGGDDSDADPTAAAKDEPTTAATEAATTAATVAATATEEPTEEAPAHEPPFGIANFDGLTCAGDWTNITFGSTGSFEATFHLNEAGDGETVSVAIGGFAFGGEAGSIEIPFTQDGSETTFGGDFGFLGTLEIVFDGAAPADDVVLSAPPALGTADSNVELTSFTFDGSVLEAEVTINFGGGSSDPAKSRLESTCS